MSSPSNIRCAGQVQAACACCASSTPALLLPGLPDRTRQQGLGFTLVEVLVVIALVTVLLSLAAPSFTRISQAAAISSGVNQFLADMRFARSDAIRRGGGVVLCRSDDPESPGATCSTTVGNSGWASGWIVFHDLDGDGARDADEDLLRVQARHAGIDTIAANGTPTTFRFGATGRWQAPGSIASLHFGGSSLDADIRRVVCVSAGGRARIAGDGTATCGADG